MIEQIIPYSFYLLFFLTPLFWTSLNYELFEYNKMILTYGFTVLIVGTWVLKMIEQKTLILRRTPLDIPLLLFLGANILSTIFSIDPHTSIWGYYSRSNGGLLSLTSYLLLYFAFVSNFPKEKISNLLKVSLASGFIVSIWGILEHFGLSPSCVILRGEFNASCWIQDVQARVFASLGQPNWMAVYLSMLIFPTLYFFQTAENLKERTVYFSSLIIMYLAFTFTYSRGPTLGLIFGLLVFSAFIFNLKNIFLQIGAALAGGHLILLQKIKLNNLVHFRPFLLVVGSFIVINILFGSALTSFKLVSKFASPSRPAIALPQQVGTQLENGGTESGQIRFIVWKGALDIFRHYPIFGSGLETFAYSYYKFRPASHNLTSEWDFLYNKAHNEYLNYLATTGVVGFGTYLIIIISFIKFIMVILKRKGTDHLLLLSLLASYISYLIYNFFLFSVVIIALFFYLFPALVFVATDSLKSYRLQLAGYRFAKVVVILVTLFLLYSIFKLWYADVIFTQGQKASDLGNPGRTYNLLAVASDLNQGEPFYRSELAYSAAGAAAALKETDATLSATLKDEAIAQLEATLNMSPNNTSFWRTAIRTYFELASLDDKYMQDTLKALDTTIKLAPTDPKLYYNKALILISEDKKEEAIKLLEQALKLKPNYLEVKNTLNEIN